MPSPTSGSPARSAKAIQAPPWLARFLNPFLARQIAREMAKDNPGLGPDAIAAKMRADLGHSPSADEEALIQAVVARLPREDRLVEERPVSALVLVAANLVPLAGVLLWDWNVFTLLALFWMENVIVGVFFILRMLLADPADPALWAGKLFLVPFFCIHYGMFTAGHGVFVFSMFGEGKYRVDGLWVVEPALRAASDYGLWLAIAVLVASHLFSFLWNYLGRGEFRSVELKTLMIRPYGRVVVLHLAIIFGGMAAMALGAPVWALIVLVAIKVGLDLKAHLKEHATSPP